MDIDIDRLLEQARERNRIRAANGEARCTTCHCAFRLSGDSLVCDDCLNSDRKPDNTPFNFDRLIKNAEVDNRLNTLKRMLYEAGFQIRVDRIDADGRAIFDITEIGGYRHYSRPNIMILPYLLNDTGSAMSIVMEVIKEVHLVYHADIARLDSKS